VLGEFGAQINPVTGGTPGPLHNQIPQPDRAVDNVSIWAPDFTEGYYEKLLFSDMAGDISMRNFYKELSSNRYTVNGDVTNWVQVPFNEARYGMNLCGSIITSFEDNNVGDHCASGRCGGLFLPVDAHPTLLIRPDNGKIWRPRVQSYDSTFGLEATDKITLHAGGQAATYGGLPANPLFDDSKSYWVAPNPAIDNFGWASVPVPNNGVTIRVVSVSAQDGFMQVEVRTAK